MFMRRRRLTLILLNMIFLGVVEARAIEDFKTMVAIQVLSKIVSPWYFMACTRFDAKHKSFFEIQGVWGAAMKIGTSSFSSCTCCSSRRCCRKTRF